MSFRDNLQHLRATRNMTQEQLAMLLGVSRQAVGKWEAERAYPEMDKLLKICEIFGCSLDDLVTGDLTDRPDEPELSLPADAPATDVTGYDELMLRFAARIALGVGLIIFGCGAGGLATEGVWFNRTFGELNPVVPIMGFLALGLMCIIPAAFEREAYAKAHPYLINFYAPEQAIAEKALRGRQLAAGVCIVLLGLVAQSFFPHDEGAEVFAFFSFLAPGVGLIVYAALALGRLNIEEYNDDSLGDLTYAEIDALDDPAIAERARAMKRESYLYGAIMLGATALGLSLLFLSIGMEWEFLTPIFWLPWPIGGITCGIVACLRRMR